MTDLYVALAAAAIALLASIVSFEVGVSIAIAPDVAPDLNHRARDSDQQMESRYGIVPPNHIRTDAGMGLQEVLPGDEERP